MKNKSMSILKMTGAAAAAGAVVLHSRTGDGVCKWNKCKWRRSRRNEQ